MDAPLTKIKATFWSKMFILKLLPKMKVTCVPIS